MIRPANQRIALPVADRQSVLEGYTRAEILAHPRRKLLFTSYMDAAEGIHEAEEAIRKAVREGASLREARERHGYHALQTRVAK